MEENLELAKKAMSVNDFKSAEYYFKQIVHQDELLGEFHFGIIPYYALSLIYATNEDWVNCEVITTKALEINPDDIVMLNHMGVAICSQDNDFILRGLYFLKKGFELGDLDKCGKNYLYWYNKIK